SRRGIARADSTLARALRARGARARARGGAWRRARGGAPARHRPQHAVSQARPPRVARAALIRGNVASPPFQYAPIHSGPDGSAIGTGAQVTSDSIWGKPGEAGPRILVAEFDAGPRILAPSMALGVLATGRATGPVTVETVASLAECVERARRSPLDLVVVDE